MSEDHGSALERIQTLRLSGAEALESDDLVIAECPVALVYNGISHAVMLATPSDLVDFALGFSLNEGVVENASELSLIGIRELAQGIIIEMAIPAVRENHLQRIRTGSSACGLCGVESLTQALRPAPRVETHHLVRPAAITAALRDLAALQTLNRLSGGVHAAAYVHAGGILLREDVGRHNALDKLIGARALAPLGEGFLLMSSRASYELVHKAAMAQISVMVTISAPTSLAIRLADQRGICLVSFARESQMNVYTHRKLIQLCD